MIYMPRPVIIGFTAGIAVSIFSSQVKDALGLHIDKVPAEFLPRWTMYAQHLDTAQPAAIALTLFGLAVIMGLRRWRPNWPGFLISVLACSAAGLIFNLPVETLGSRFGTLPSALPVFQFPQIPLSRTFELLPSSLTIAFLGGVESLMLAAVADGMIGGRCRTNMELVAQGTANVGAALFGGLPATGAIARTATGIRAGARSPVAGILHSAFLLLFLLLLAPLMSYVPLAALAAVLLMVAWNISEHRHFRRTLSAPKGDRLVLLTTFLLTVFIDLTVAIGTGLVIASFVFMYRMSRAVEVRASTELQDESGDPGETEEMQREQLPPGVEVFRINGPLFFGASGQLDSLLDNTPQRVMVFILRTRLMPIIDATGVHAIEALAERCRRQGTVLILSGLQSQPQRVLTDMHFTEHYGEVRMVPAFEDALVLARQIAASNSTG